VWLQLTGQELQAKTVFGKPHPQPYRLIEQLLESQARKLGYVLPDTRQVGLDGTPLPPFPKVFAVGDNPAADVRGANAAGHPWVSVLVRTGVFKSAAANCVVDPAHIVVDDVEHAITAAYHHLRSVKWHSMR
jgi:ribonucleotide monophosphatase NagD (HAD superfamily)